MPHKGSYGGKTGKVLEKARAKGKAMHKRPKPKAKRTK